MRELLVFIPAMFIIISIGWGLKRIGFLGPADVEVLNKIIIYVSLPALIFLAVQRADLSLSVAKFPLFAIVIMLLTLAVAFAAGRLLKLSPALKGAFLLVAAMGNTGYLGFPMTIGLYGQQNLIKSVFYDFGTVALLFTLGIIIAGYYGDPERKMNAAKEFVMFPSVLALAAGLLFNPVPLPDFLIKTLDYLGQATVPVIMLTVGLTLEGKKIGKYAAPLMAMLLLKLVLSPVFGYLAAAAGGLSGTDLGIVVLEASMPAVMLSLVVGLRYKLDTEFTSLAILVSIIASLVTIPAVQAVFRLITA
ncbi:MAG: AEC family transporter [Actinomycetota bacterium]